MFHVRGVHAPPPEKNSDLPNFNPERAHLFLQGVHENYLHHNYGLHLDGGVADDAIWQHRWRRLATQLASWYTKPSGTVGRHFTTIMYVEWWESLRRTWKSEISLVFAHFVLTKTLGICRAKEIRARITRWMDL